MNPLVLLAPIEKLINEHGSATILRDHLMMFKDQVVLLEKKATLLESENTILKQNLEKSESKVNQLTKDNEELRSKIQRRDDAIQKEKSHKNLLDDNKVKILTFLSTQQDYLTPDDISHSINTGLQIVKFHLEELEKTHMVHCLLSVAPGEYSLAQEGRRYLIENKLIP